MERYRRNQGFQWWQPAASAAVVATTKAGRYISRSTEMETDKIISAVVDQVEPYGLYLAVKDERIFIQIPDIDWVRRIPDPREFTCVGETFNVIVYGYNEQNKLYYGSIREASPEKNPWKNPEAFTVGTCHQSKVILNTDYGTFVEIISGVEALIALENSGGDFELGSKFNVQVISLDLDRKQLTVKKII